MRLVAALVLALLLLPLAGCEEPTTEIVPSAPTADDPVDAPNPPSRLRPPEKGEKHFASLRQLTFGGQNAEAYWSFDEKRLIFQATRAALTADQIFVMDADGSNLALVSTGKGRTTCAYFLPGDKINVVSEKFISLAIFCISLSDNFLTFLKTAS